MSATSDAELETEDGMATARPKPGWMRPAVIGAAALVGLVALGGGGYFLMAPSAPTAGAPASVTPEKPPAFLDLPEVMVNLAVTGSERTQYLRIRAVLEVSDPSLAPKIQPYLPRVVDAFQVFLRELRPSDLEGSAGIYRLREELTRRVNAAIAPLQVNAVLFKEMVIQ